MLLLNLHSCHPGHALEVLCLDEPLEPQVKGVVSWRAAAADLAKELPAVGIPLICIQIPYAAS